MFLEIYRYIINFNTCIYVQYSYAFDSFSGKLLKKYKVYVQIRLNTRQ